MLANRDMRQANKRKVSASATQHNALENKPLVARDERGRILPGYSGNPGGKAPESHDYKVRCRDIMERVGIQELERLAVSAQSEAVRVSAIAELANRAYGKAPQAITGEGGGPIEHIWRIIEDAPPQQAIEAPKEEG